MRRALGGPRTPNLTAIELGGAWPPPTFHRRSRSAATRTPFGDAEYNRRLSQHRVDAVKQILEDKYPSLRSHVHATGLGPPSPVAPNRLNGRDNPAGRRQNRRVELEFHKVVEHP